MDYQLLFESTPARLLVVTPEPVHRILGGSDAYLDATLFAVFPDNPGDPAANGVERLSASFERSLASRGADVMPVQKYDIRDRSGRFVERYWTPVNAPAVAGDGEIKALVHRVEDVTAFVRRGQVLEGEAAQLRSDILARGEDLARANSQLRELTERQRRIAAIVGHDLRGPLGTMRVGVEVLRRQFVDAGTPAPPIIGTLQASSTLMAELLGDLDDYSTTQLEGVLVASRKRVNLRAIFDEVVEAMRLAHLGALVVLEPGESIAAEVDPHRMRQLLSNLIQNAVSYGTAGRPIVVSLRRVTGACVLTVSNEGPPLPEEIIPVLFEPFRRGPRTGNETQRGHMGLGLFIVREIVRAHDGRIDVKSTPDRTDFSVYLPVTNS